MSESRTPTRFMPNYTYARSNAAEELNRELTTSSQVDQTFDPLPASTSIGHALLLGAPPGEWNTLPIDSLSYRLGKRAFDLVLAIAITPVVGLAMVIIAAAISFSSGMPIFFRQWRIGQGGREFQIWKFRTMHRDAEEIFASHLFRDDAARHEWHTTQKLRNDPRTTRLGDWLRKTSLDELPQLLNIFAGHMSFVGPRPIIRAEVPKYRNSFTYYKAAVPGLTGLWQVSGRCNVGYKARVILDSSYVCNWSFWRDLKILLKTPKAVYRRDGAY